MQSCSTLLGKHTAISGVNVYMPYAQAQYRIIIELRCVALRAVIAACSKHNCCVEPQM
jgi:hypothetical protein